MKAKVGHEIWPSKANLPKWTLNKWKRHLLLSLICEKRGHSSKDYNRNHNFSITYINYWVIMSITILNLQFASFEHSKMYSMTVQNVMLPLNRIFLLREVWKNLDLVNNKIWLLHSSQLLFSGHFIVPPIRMSMVNGT